jgi:hypothetical protein
MGVPQGGVSPTICSGTHAGCSPKIVEICETEARKGYGTTGGSVG